ncbi:methyl-accepting chemotaxis protein [Chamaesiphon sp. GL140_3_metabinner_50]|uniref:methyl-accepting chemotaxis protein n=1 Tax=Chamaesiphon sp. GL140_3_metabinner_50 TaxID=2970812 RepID=UPI0025F5E795|nr:methyl-accepting chemotaxis protein [Chamaesiphon sp. GL140_3_metabinner_50]
MSNTFKANFQDRFNSLSFKTKAVSVVVLLSTLPVVGIGGLAYMVAYDSLQTAEAEQQQYVAESFKGNLIRFMILRRKDIQSLSVSSVLTNPKLRASSSVAEIETYLDRFADTYKFYDSIIVFDLQGNPLYASKGSRRDNHSDRAYFQATLKTGKAQITSAEISKSSGKAVYHITAPIRDSSTGQLIGVVRAQMPVEAIKVLAKAFGDTKNRNEWHILDRNLNQFILAQKEDRIGRTGDDFSSSKKLKNSQQPATVTDTNQLNGKSQLTSYLAVAETADLPDLGLTVLIAKDTTDIFAKEQALMVVIALGMLATGGVTLGLSLLLSNRVTKFIKQLADSIVNSSEAIVETVESQEITVNMQANSAIDTSKTVNELGAISFQSAAQAEASANGARQALSLSEDGTRSVQQTLQGMNGLRDKVDAIANQIVNLSEQTGQITIVSDLVADLASQTNMLALNAAVEAARAGEQGRGFSVVADEIRKLADQSKKSADKINALAEDIQTAINRTVMVTDEGTKTVNEGIDLARSTAVTFAGVTDAVNNVFLNSQQISTSAKQQAVSIQQVLSSMTMISQGSQESAVGMHQVKMTTRELNQVADELKAAVV